MYRLILDRAVASDYVNVTAPAIGVKPDALEPAFYPILRHHSRPLSTAIFGDSVLPVRTLVSIRTDLSNEVLVPDDGEFYTDCTDSYPNEHPLDDTIMLSAKSLVDRLFDCGDNLPLVIRRTTVYPLGACILNDQVYVYSNVVIDHTLKNDPIFKTKGCHFEKIVDQSSEDTLGKELLKHLTLVKGENNDV